MDSRPPAVHVTAVVGLTVLLGLQFAVLGRHRSGGPRPPAVLA